MAQRFGIAQIEGVATGTSIKTMIQLIAATNHAILLTEIGVGFHGVDNTDEPILVQLIRQTDAGTMSSLTLVKADQSVADTLDTTAQHTATVEPTNDVVYRSWTVHPQTGLIVPANDLGKLIIKAADRVGLVMTAADSVACDAYIHFEE